MMNTPPVMARNASITHKPPKTGIRFSNTLQVMRKTANKSKTMFLFDLPMEGVLNINE
jgi:hypothetical protein